MMQVTYLLKIDDVCVELGETVAADILKAGLSQSTITNQCADDQCSLLDFLPLQCRCGKVFCSEHLTCHIETCTKSRFNELEKVDYTFVCSKDGCKAKNVVPLICQRCKKHYCIQHRHLTECEDKSQDVIDKEKERFAEPVRQFNEAKAVVDEQVQELLPDGYDYIIVKKEYCATRHAPNGFFTIVRLKIKTKDSVLTWLEAFQQKNLITLRVLHGYEENAQKILFKKEYRCVHNTRPKRGSTPHPKHTNCTAKVIVTIKNPRMRRSKDAYLKTHPCKVYIRHTHNHVLCRPSTRDLEDTYGSVFEDDRSSSAEEGKDKIADLDATGATEDPTSCAEDLQGETDDLRDRLNGVVEKIVHKYKSNREEFKGPVEAFIENFNSCQSNSALVTALQTFGAEIRPVKRGSSDDVPQSWKDIDESPSQSGGTSPKLLRLSEHCYSKGSL